MSKHNSPPSLAHLSIRSPWRCTVIPFLLTVLAAWPGLAAVKTWDGSYSPNWSAPQNWTGNVAPVNGDDLVFPPGAANLSNTNNNAVSRVNSITFTGTGYTVGSSSGLIIANGISSQQAAGINTVTIDLALGGAQTFECVNAGATLRVSGAIFLGANTLTVANSGNTTLSGAISGTRGLTKNGSGTLTLAGPLSNTYGGTTVVNAGLLQLDKVNFPAATAIPGNLVIGGGALAATVRNVYIRQIADTADVTVNANGLWDLNNYDETIGPNLTLSGGGNVQSGTGTLTVSPDGIITVNSSTSTISGKLDVSSGTCVLQGSGSLTLSASVSGSASITKSGSGAVLLTASNSFSGPITINEGILTAGNSWALGTTDGGTTVNDPGTLGLCCGGINIVGEALRLNAVTGYANYGALLCTGGVDSWSGPITLATNSIIQVNCAGCDLNLNGAISGPGGFTKIGPSTLTLSGSSDNTYTGATVVNEGLLELNKSSGLAIQFGSLTVGDGVGGADADVVRYTGPGPGGNQLSIGVPITVNSSGLLDLNNYTHAVGPITLSGGDIATGSGLLLTTGDINVQSSSRTAHISGGLRIVSGHLLTITVDHGSAFYDIIITASISDGGGGLQIVNGASPGAWLALQGSNYFTGPLTIKGLTVSAATPWALGATNGGTVVRSGGDLFVYSTGITNESLTLDAGSVLTGQYDCTWAGPITLTGDATILGFGFPGLFDIQGLISGTGNLTSATAGSTNRFSGALANTYAGTTIAGPGLTELNKSGSAQAVPHDLVISGTVRLLNKEQIANIADVLVQGGGLFDLGTSFNSINTLHGTGTVHFGNGGYLTVGVNNGTSQFDGVMTGIGYWAGRTLSKVGIGTFTLTGNNTFSAGHTYISGGTLVINGSQPQSEVVVENGAMLKGTGVVGSIFSMGTVAPGTSPGILTSSNLTFSSLGNFSVELTGPAPGTGYDQLNVRGTNTLANAKLMVTPAFTSPVSIGSQFTILNNDGADPITGTFNGLPGGATINVGGFGFLINYTGGNGNDVVLTVTDVPLGQAGATVSAGNGNHTIDPNECNNLYLVITNKTAIPMMGITTTLSSTTPAVMITQPYSTYPTVAGNGTAANLTPFQLSTLSGFFCGSDINLLLTVSSSLGAFTTPFGLHSGAPSVAATRFDNNTVTNVPDVGTIESTNTVSSWSGGLVTKVAVSLWLGAPIDSDLSISLLAPDGTTVPLVAGVGAGAHFGTGSADATRTTFDDAAATAITAGTPPFVGTFRPQGSLGSLIGTSPTGNWRLHIQDNGFFGSPDTLRAWSLFLYGTTCAPGKGFCDTCLPPISGSITTNDLVQTGRLMRDGIVSSCGRPKSCPDLNDSSARHYDIYPFTNTNSFDACISVGLESSDVAFAAIYLNSFAPASLCANYLGDAGTSTPTSLTMSVTVPTGATFFVTVNEITPNAGCRNYILRVTGLGCPPPRLDIADVASAQVGLFWPTWAGGYQLEGTPALDPTTWSFVPDEPVVSGGKYGVTNSSAAPIDRFYRLHKP